MPHHPLHLKILEILWRFDQITPLFIKHRSAQATLQGTCIIEQQLRIILQELTGWLQHLKRQLLRLEKRPKRRSASDRTLLLFEEWESAWLICLALYPHLTQEAQSFVPGAPSLFAEISKQMALLSSHFEKVEGLLCLSQRSELMTIPTAPVLLTVREVAQRLRVDDTTVRRWVKQGALEAVVLPHLNERQAYRIKKETLDRLLGEGLPS